MLLKPYIKFPLLFGFLASVCVFISLIILNKTLNINPLGGKKEIGIIFLIIAMILAVSATRKANEGAISLRSGYGVSFSTTIIFSIFSLLFLYIFLQILAPNVLPQYILTTQTELIKNKSQIIVNGISEQAYEDALSGINKTTLKSILIDDFIKKIFLAIIPSFMISLYFKRRFIN